VTVAPAPWAELLAELGRTPDRLRALAPDPAAAPLIESLCAFELPYRAGLVRIILEDNPELPPEPGPENGRSTWPWPAIIEHFAALRRDTLAFLEHLPPEARARVASHPSLGRVTLRQQVEALLAHDAAALHSLRQ
jgi:hypothetical protein